VDSAARHAFEVSIADVAHQLGLDPSGRAASPPRSTWDPAGAARHAGYLRRLAENLTDPTAETDSARTGPAKSLIPAPGRSDRAQPF
jgi:hypothetical protein